jgi:hypothetical protein
MLYLDLYIVQFAYKQDSLNDQHQYNRPIGTNIPIIVKVFVMMRNAVIIACGLEK